MAMQAEDRAEDARYLAALQESGIRTHRPVEFGHWRDLPRCYCGAVWPCPTTLKAANAE